MPSVLFWQEGKNNLEKATRSLADRKLYYLAHMILLVGNPLVEEYLETLAQHSEGALGVATWLGNRSTGCWQKISSALLGLLSSSVFERLGLPTTCTSTGMADDRDKDEG